jgi:hypothetical protein
MSCACLIRFFKLRSAKLAYIITGAAETRSYRESDPRREETGLWGLWMTTQLRRRLVTFDAFGTLFKPKRPMYLFVFICPDSDTRLMHE